MAKESITGYLDICRDVGRLENNTYIQVGSLYYDPEVGFDMAYWMQSGVNFGAEAFNIWYINQATRRGIIITESALSVSGFILNLNYTLADGSLQVSAFEQGFNAYGSVTGG